MATTMGSIDLKSLQGLRDDLTQYFWFESNSSATYGAGVHITLSPESSFISSPTGQNILMNTDGISIRNGVLPMMVLDNDSLDFNVVDTTNSTYTNVASFGASGATIGVTDGTQSYLHEDYHSLQMIDRAGLTYFHVSDLRDQNGFYTHTDTWTGDGTTAIFDLTLTATDDDYQVLKNGVDVTSQLATKSVYLFRFSTNSIPAKGDTITCTYETTDQRAKAYTMGVRRPMYTTGPMSIVAGWTCAASNIYSYAEGFATRSEGFASHSEGQITYATGIDSHAEGKGSTASGGYSHAEGWTSIASGQCSHAEGWGSIASGQDSHAEGTQAGISDGNEIHLYETTASGLGSHAEGCGTTASGDNSHSEGILSSASGSNSHAQNQYTIASKVAQTTIGSFNEEDTSSTTTHPSGTNSYGKYALILGNGTADDARSNALTVDWAGNVDIASGAKYKIGGVALGSIVSSLGSSSTSNISATANSAKTLLSVSLTAGTWIVMCTARFAPSASGSNNTAVVFSTTSNDDSWYDRKFATGTYTIQHSFTTVVTPTATTNYYLSGSTTTAGAWQRNNGNACSIRAVRIA